MCLCVFVCVWSLDCVFVCVCVRVVGRVCCLYVLLCVCAFEFLCYCVCVCFLRLFMWLVVWLLGDLSVCLFVYVGV